VRVLASPCYIIGDTHLGVGPPDLERRVVGFLRAAAVNAKSLVINGDLFDFWFEWRTVIPRDHFRTLAALADARDAGVQVLMIAGNHDCWGGEFLSGEVGVRYQLGPWTGSVAGWQTRIDHGDGLRVREDRKYRALRRVLRHPLSMRAFRWLHPDWGTRLARGSSNASRTYRARDEGAGLRAVAHATLEANAELDLLVLGHSHVPTLERAARGAVYANAGSWLDAPTYLVVTPGRVELREWNGSAEGHRLHAIDRRSEEALPHS
jgi:UDP-2,3-diacylglucosamine hydrolase